MVKNKKDEEVIFPVAVVLAAVLLSSLLSGLVIRPLYKNLAKNTAELKNKKIELASLEDKLENLISLKEKETELREKNEKVLAALPENKDVPRLFTQFENLAVASGVTVDKVSENSPTSTGTTTPSGSIGAVSYQVNGNTPSYLALKTALLSLDQALRLLAVSSINVTTTNGKIDFILNIDAYTRGVK